MFQFPFPFSAHLIFVIVSVVLLSIQYKRKHYPYLICMIAGIISTLLSYVCSDNKVLFYILGGIQFVLIVAMIILMIKKDKKKPEDKNGEENEDSNS